MSEPHWVVQLLKEAKASPGFWAAIFASLTVICAILFGWLQADPTAFDDLPTTGAWIKIGLVVSSIATLLFGGRHFLTRPPKPAHEAEPIPEFNVPRLRKPTQLEQEIAEIARLRAEPERPLLAPIIKPQIIHGDADLSKPSPGTPRARYEAEAEAAEEERKRDVETKLDMLSDSGADRLRAIGNSGLESIMFDSKDEALVELASLGFLSATVDRSRYLLTLEGKIAFALIDEVRPLRTPEGASTWAREAKETRAIMPDEELFIRTRIDNLSPVSRDSLRWFKTHRIERTSADASNRALIELCGAGFLQKLLEDRDGQAMFVLTQSGHSACAPNSQLLALPNLVEPWKTLPAAPRILHEHIVTAADEAEAKQVDRLRRRSLGEASAKAKIYLACIANGNLDELYADPSDPTIEELVMLELLRYGAVGTPSKRQYVVPALAKMAIAIHRNSAINCAPLPWHRYTPANRRV